ncbi:MAG: hypothetical protein J3R72DRAFT_486093 [Linnemannia gamsii]|nr:MAG: hypothetical protein J3R72DRAFT_486093 [Linnemannia gamsii]
MSTKDAYCGTLGQGTDRGFLENFEFPVTLDLLDPLEKFLDVERTIQSGQSGAAAPTFAFNGIFIFSLSSDETLCDEEHYLTRSSNGGNGGKGSKKKDLGDEDEDDADTKKLKGALASAILSEKPDVKWSDVAGLDGCKGIAQGGCYPSYQVSASFYWIGGTSDRSDIAIAVLDALTMPIRKMSWENVEGDQLLEPSLGMADFLKAVKNVWPTVSADDVTEHTKFTLEFGSEG